MPNLPLEDTTVRQIIRVTTGGEKLRLRLSNQYGESDVTVKSLHLAKQVKTDESTVDPSTDVIVTVGGKEEFVIPKGKVIRTDAGKDRFARDLLEHDGVGYCIILFGVNDLNKLQNTDKYDELLPEYKKMIQLCHDNGIKVYGAPILPFGTSDYYSDASEEVRTKINNWMRSDESKLDGIIDFESAVADPDDPKNVLEKYTHTDGLHPYDGYEVMANAIDLTMFE